MTPKHLIVIVDDSWPYDPESSDTGPINSTSINKFINSNFDWSELTLKRFVKALIKRATPIEQVEIVGFRRIEHYLNSLDKNEIRVPNIFVVDWDFGVVGDDCHKASEYLPKVIENRVGLENLYIFSRSDNMNEISECLIQPNMIVPGLSIFLYDKEKKEHQQGSTLEKLIDRVLRSVENVDGKSFVYNKLTVTFYASEYLKHYLDFWKVDAIIGTQALTTFLESHDQIVNKANIEALFEECKTKFFVDSENKFLLVGSFEKFEEQLGVLNETSAFQALRKFGISKIEKALEKSIVQL